MRFNCTGCHERNGEGGLSATLHRLLTENQSAAEADLIRPPTLTGIAAKLHSAALAAVLLHGERARPWMALKMPHFASEHVAPLVAALPALEGHIPAEPSAPSSPDAELSKAGRALVGSQGFGCIKCHDIRGIPTSGTRGPDLARVGQRIRRDWYERWMTDPQRIEPGTRMPTVFFGGQSPYKNVLDGNPERQIAAIWHYLSAGNELELPEGLETPGGGKPLIASGQPLVMRTFLPNVSPRALAIQFPNQVHVAFDAQTCRVAYAWRGDFLDMSPVWTGRGGRPAELAGELLWTAPAGFPWAITPTAQQEVPDFAAQAADVEVGALPPDDGRVYASRLRFRGYRVAPQGPVLQYVLRQGDGQILQFEQSLRTRSDARGQSVEQQFVVQSPGNARLWLHPAQSDRPPELLTGGTATPLADNRDVPALETAIAIHQAERTLICQVRDCTTDQARWRAVRAGDQWSLVLMLDISQQPLRVDLETIAPSDDRPEATAAWLRNADSPAQQ
jgi:mono/diheme cytochrome c family protein